MIYLGSDHRGYSLKEKLKAFLTVNHWEFEDLGNDHPEPEDDFVDYATRVAKKVVNDKNSLGIVVCGSGVGVCIAANKISGVRCGLGATTYIAEKGRSHDHINILALPADILKETEAFEIVKTFLETKPLEQEKYLRRINKITQLENS